MLTANNFRLTYGLLSQEESLEFLDLLEKGKAAEIGEIRVWSGQQYVKHSDGWVHIHPATGRVSVLPTSGKIRRLDGNDEHWAHFLKHTKEFSDLRESNSLTTKQIVNVEATQKASKYIKEFLKVNPNIKTSPVTFLGDYNAFRSNKPDSHVKSVDGSLLYVFNKLAYEFKDLPLEQNLLVKTFKASGILIKKIDNQMALDSYRRHNYSVEFTIT